MDLELKYFLEEDATAFHCPHCGKENEYYCRCKRCGVVVKSDIERQLKKANELLRNCYEYFEWSENTSKEDCIKQDDLSEMIYKHLVIKD